MRISDKELLCISDSWIMCISDSSAHYTGHWRVSGFSEAPNPFNFLDHGVLESLGLHTMQRGAREASECLALDPKHGWDLLLSADSPRSKKENRTNRAENPA